MGNKEMTPKEALAHIENPLTHIHVVPGGCPECLDALAALEFLVNQPRTVAEIRAEVERLEERTDWPTSGVLNDLIEFIDGKDKT